MYQLGVVSHVDRVRQREFLSGALEPDVILPDDGSLGVAGNHAAVFSTLRLRARPDDWVVVLEDDAVPTPMFHTCLEQALEVSRWPIVSLYLGTGYPQNWQGRIKTAIDAQTPWIVGDQLLHAVGYAIAPDISRDIGLMLAHAARQPRPWAPDDSISRWAMIHGEKIAYTNPSLVDHEDKGTVIRNRLHRGHPIWGRKRPRHAHVVGDRLTWNDTFVTL